MTTLYQRTLPHALFTGGLALFATLASFSATVTPAHAAVQRTGYAAGLAAPLAAPRREVIGGMLWKCEGDRCSAVGEGSRPVLVCERVARKFGAVARFNSPDGELSAEELARCNGGK